MRARERCIIFRLLYPTILNYTDAESILGKGPLFKRLFGGFTGFILFIAFGFKKMRIIKDSNDGKFWGIFMSAIKEQLKFKV